MSFDRKRVFLLFGIILLSLAVFISTWYLVTTKTRVFPKATLTQPILSGGPTAESGTRQDCCQIEKAFDNNFDTFWAGAPLPTGQKWMINADFGPTTQLPYNTPIIIAYHAQNTGGEYWPADMKVEVSADALSWRVVANVDKPNQANYPLSAPIPFRAVRVTFTSGINANNSQVAPIVREITIGSKAEAIPMIYKVDFNHGTNGWESLTFHNQQLGNLVWSDNGGINNTGHIYSSGEWWPDPNQQPPPYGVGFFNMLAFTFTSRLVPTFNTYAVDFRNATVTARFKGEDLNLKGARLKFWFQAWSPDAQRYVNYMYHGPDGDGVPDGDFTYAITDPEWKQVQFTLDPDPRYWTCMGTNPAFNYFYGCVSDDAGDVTKALSDVNRDFGFLLFPVQGREFIHQPTGTIRTEDITLSYALKVRASLPSVNVSPPSAPAGATVDIQWHAVPVPFPVEQIQIFTASGQSIPGAFFYTSSCSQEPNHRNYTDSGRCSFQLPQAMTEGIHQLRLLWGADYNVVTATAPFTVTIATPQPTATPPSAPSPTPLSVQSTASGGPNFDDLSDGTCCQPRLAFDGHLNTFWAGAESGRSGSGWNVYYNYPMLQPAGTMVTINYFPGYYPGGGAELKVSNDGSSYTTVAFVPNAPITKHYINQEFKYIHLVLKAGPASLTPPYIREISLTPPRALPPLQLVSGTATADLTYPQPTGRSDCCQAGLALDNNLSTFWAGATDGFSQGGWALNTEYTSAQPLGTMATINYYRNYFPGSAVLEVSADGNDYVKVASIPNQPTSTHYVNQAFQHLRLRALPGSQTPPYISEIHLRR